jgi:hypothetical protein
MNIDWDGKGLPPVGIKCDTLWSSTTGEYVQVKVLAHDEDRAVVRFVTGSRKGEYDSDTQHSQYGATLPIFRPIRTPEQIAADQRLHAIRNACTAINSRIAEYNINLDCSVAMRATVEAMIDAGYRKFEIVEEDV